jgi:phenylpropionate dioxygenase-like ring-hydroxylating dioxygenase large terminal subunit
MTMMIVGHRSELIRDGQYIRLPANPWFDGELIIINYKNALFVVDNECTHRYAKVYSKPAITPVNGFDPNHRCPYHGWRYFPNRNSLSNSIPVKIVGDWVVIGEDLEMRDYQFNPYLSSSKELSLNPEHCMYMVMDCSTQIAVENALDSEHARYVHKKSLCETMDLSLEKSKLFLGPGGASTHWFDVTSSRALEKLKDLGTFDINSYVHCLVSPFSALSSIGGVMWSLQLYIPSSDRKSTHFIHRLYSRQGHRLVSPMADLAFYKNKQTFEEDAKICAGISRPVESYRLTHLQLDEWRILHLREAHDYRK